MGNTGILKIILVLIKMWGVFGDFTLTLLHINDVHSRFEATNKYGGICHQPDIDSKKCFGGISRIKSKVGEIRDSHENVLFFNAGDQYEGTLWFSYYRGNASGYYTEKLGFDAQCFGNHEFDNGVSGLLPYVQRMSSPFLAANLDASNEPMLNGTFQPSVDLQVGGQTVGVVGYITKETSELVNPSGIRNLKFYDEIASVRKEVVDMTARGVNKIIVLGHGGYGLDQQLAKQIEGVDVVVGGHSHTFLYSGENPPDKPAGRYPTVVTRDSGSKALVVTAKSFGKYLGYLNITWDDDGKVVEYEGNPILLDGSVPQDKDTLAEVEKWKQPLEALLNQSVGETYVYLNGNRGSCRLEECTMGNFVADAIVYYMMQLSPTNNDFWTNASIAVMNSGGIRGSVGKGPITMGDIMTAFPFRNSIEKVAISGAMLLKMLETSADRYRPRDTHGGFLQFSGIHVTYDMDQEKGRRVVDARVRCSACSQPKFEVVDKQAVYFVLANSFLLNGGDGYDIKSILRYNYQFSVADIVVDYVQKMSPVMIGLENRIKFMPSPRPVTCGATCPFLINLGLCIGSLMISHIYITYMATLF